MIYLISWFLFRRAWRLIISRHSNTPVAGRLADSNATDPEIMSSPVLADSSTVRLRCFNGDSGLFEDWCFSMEPALRSRNINYGCRQVEIALSSLEGNALLWLISCQEAGAKFNKRKKNSD